MAKNALDRRRSWLGGEIRYDKQGRPIFIIRRRIGHGRQPKISTRCHTESGALVELARFEKDPEGYIAGGPGSSALFLDKELAKSFLMWSKNDVKNTPEWVTKQRGYLAWWADEFRGVDLRKVTLAKHILGALDRPRGPKRRRVGARQHRIAVLKSFYTWLRVERDAITTIEDPTYGKLKVPQSRPEQWIRQKAIPRETLLAVREKLDGHWRDALTVLMGTGWHVTELVRFTSTGSVVEKRGAEGAAGVLLNPRQKSGEPQRTAVSLDVLEAGRRLRARGGFSRTWFYRALRNACEAAEVTPFPPGVLRHSVAHHAIEEGSAAGEVSTFLGQKSPQTMKRFYATHATPGKVPTPA